MVDNHFQKGLAVCIILLFIGICIIPSNAKDTEKLLQTSRGNWLYVGGNGTGNYTKIQDALDDASSGDTVFVYNGTYYENVIVNKTINLIGESKNTTIIDGSGIGDVVLVCIDQVNISRFTIQNSGGYYQFDAGIDIHANNTYIFDNNITNNNAFGIVIGIEDNHLYHHNIINKNLLSKNSDVNIWIEESDYNDISNNIIFQDQTNSGICTRYSNYCKIENNTILDSPYGITLFDGSYATVTNNIIKNCLIIGIGLDGHHHSLIGFNYIENCTWNPYLGDGIKIEYQSDNNTIINNYINNTSVSGIWLFSRSNNNTIKDNTVKNCNYYGIIILPQSGYGPCNNNLIYHNNFFGNIPENAYDECTNIWDNDYPSGGNYWDDYTGEDNNSDGIGDTPYNIPGGGNKDRYPLMNLWNEPPGKPSDPNPENGAIGVSINPVLSVYISDLEGNNMNVSFYDATTHNLIGTSYNVPSFTRARVTWNNLTTNTTYFWYAIADDGEYTNQSETWEFTTVGEYTNHPPEPPTIDGPVKGKSGEDYKFTLITTDPDGDKVFYYIEWGDETNTEYIGPYESGETILRNHTWSDEDDYTIKVRCKDTQNLWGPFSEYNVSIVPAVEIVNPKKGYLHLFGVPLFPTLLNLLADAVAFGGFRIRPIQVSALGDEVWLYINNKNMGLGTWNSETGYYEWRWTGMSFGKNNLRVVARDKYGVEDAEDQAFMSVWNLCFLK